MTEQLIRPGEQYKLESAPMCLVYLVWEMDDAFALREMKRRGIEFSKS